MRPIDKMFDIWKPLTNKVIIEALLFLKLELKFLDLNSIDPVFERDTSNVC